MQEKKGTSAMQNRLDLLRLRITNVNHFGRLSIKTCYRHSSVKHSIGSTPQGRIAGKTKMSKRCNYFDSIREGSVSQIP